MEYTQKHLFFIFNTLTVNNNNNNNKITKISLNYEGMLW